jgi:branched-chain amino acid transport system permease protein
MFAIYVSSSDLTLVAVNALVATSLYMTMVAGIFSLGQVAFMAIGAYGFGYTTVTLEWPVWLATLAGGGAAMLISLVIALPLLRVSGIYLAIITIALIRIVQLAAAASDDLGGPAGLYVPIGLSAWPAWIVLFVSLALLVAAMRLPLGAALRGLGSDEQLTRSLGVYTPGVKIATFTLGGLIAGLAGALYARSTGWIAPDLFDLERAIQVVLFAVVGGFGSAISPPVGAAALTLLTIVSRSFGEWQAVIYGVIVLVIIIWRPAGLFTGLARMLPRPRSAT